MQWQMDFRKLKKGAIIFQFLMSREMLDWQSVNRSVVGRADAVCVKDYYAIRAADGKFIRP